MGFAFEVVVEAAAFPLPFAAALGFLIKLSLETSPSAPPPPTSSSDDSAASSSCRVEEERVRGREKSQLEYDKRSGRADGKEDGDDASRTNLVDVLLICLGTRRDLLRGREEDSLVERNGMFGLVVPVDFKDEKNPSASKSESEKRKVDLDERSRETRLDVGRNLLENSIVLPLSDSEFNESVPVLLVEVVLVHRLDHGSDLVLLNRNQKTRSRQPSNFFPFLEPTRVKKAHGSRLLGHERFDQLGEERREVVLPDLSRVGRNLESHVDLDLVEELRHLGLFRVLSEPSERDNGGKGDESAGEEDSRTRKYNSLRESHSVLSSPTSSLSVREVGRSNRRHDGVSW